MTLPKKRCREKDEEWIPLLFQMEKAIDFYQTQNEDLKLDALQDASLDLMKILDGLPDLTKLKETDVVSLVVQDKLAFANIYHFGRAFYAYAKTISRNKLINLLRGKQREQKITTSLE